MGTGGGGKATPCIKILGKLICGKSPIKGGKVCAVNFFVMDIKWRGVGAPFFFHFHNVVHIHECKVSKFEGNLRTFYTFTTRPNKAPHSSKT